MKKHILCLLALLGSTSQAAVSFEEFDSVRSALYSAFKEIKPGPKHSLTINKPLPGLGEEFWWESDNVHASYVLREDQKSGWKNHDIYLMGGLARLPHMTPDQLALVGCHEIGHGLGGDPKKNPSMGFAGNTTEGQADYYATRQCLRRVLNHLPVTRPLTDSPWVQETCARFQLYPLENCLRMFTTLEDEIAGYLSLGVMTSFLTPSREIAEEFNREPTYYPSHQCRLDTMVHGLLQLKQPECWYPDGAKNGSYL